MVPGMNDEVEDYILDEFERDEAIERLDYDLRNAIFAAHEEGIAASEMKEVCWNAVFDALHEVNEINKK